MPPAGELQPVDGGAAPVAVRAAERDRQRIEFVDGMALRADPQQRLAANDLGRSLGADMGDDGDVEFARRHRVDECRGRRADHRHLGARIGGGEARQNLRQEAVGIVVGRAEPDAPGELGVGEGGERLVVETQQAPGMGEQALAVVRQARLAAVAGEDRLADPLLEAAHLHRHRRLGLGDAIGGAGEGPGLGDGDEGLQLIEIQRRGHRALHRFS